MADLHHPDVQRLEVELAERTYPVWVGVNILHRLPELVPLPARARMAAFFTDEGAVGGQEDVLNELKDSVQRAGLDVRAMSVRGERSKDLATADASWRWLAANGFHRGDLVVAFGGGVTSDLAGFVAATYHRGLPWLAVPTTLLGMVDASIGGKTGINLPEGKNLVGSFHQPLGVIADVTLLETLPDDALATGMAEVIKHGLIDRVDLLETIQQRRADILARDPDALSALVADAASVKVNIVSGDETEQGARMFLNYGHTLGHALEALGGYERWTHGQAIALGSMFAAHLGRCLGYVDLVAEHERALSAYALPTTGIPFDLAQVVEFMRKDKKFDAATRYVVLEDLGKPAIVQDPPEEAIAAAYRAVR